MTWQRLYQRAAEWQKCFRAAIRAGRWITIGSDKGDDGDNHGGSRVFVEDDGTISKGADGLTGKKIGELKKEKNEPEKPDASKKSPIKKAMTEIQSDAYKVGHGVFMSDVWPKYEAELDKLTFNELRRAANEVGIDTTGNLNRRAVMTDIRNAVIEKHSERTAERMGFEETGELGGEQSENFPPTAVDNQAGAGKMASESKPTTEGGGKMTTTLPKLTGTEKQVAFAEKVRPTLLSKIQFKIDTLRKRAAMVAAESGPQRIIDAANQDIEIMQRRHDAIAALSSASKILDAKDTDFTNTSPVVADIIDKKAGLTAKVGA